MKTKLMKTNLSTTVSVPLLGVLVGMLLTGCASLPNDGANAQTKHFDNLHTVRYIEIFVVGGNSITGNLSANVYNTTFSSGYNRATKDSSPQAYVEGIKLEQVKEQFDALGASLNGPKLWMLDWVDIPLGAERNINGLNMPWCAELNLKGVNLKEMGKVGYVTTTIERKSKIGYNKGTKVFLIDDTDGNTWIMKGFQLGLKPRWTYEEFAADPASRFQKLPSGWKFRTKVLEQDLILVPETGSATIMPDEFFNVYDKTGPGYSNYKP